MCIFSSEEKPNPRWFRSHALDVRVILLHISPSRKNMGKKFLLVQLHNPFLPRCFCPAAPLTALSAEESFTVNSREGGGRRGGGGREGGSITIWLQKRTTLLHPSPLTPHSSSLLHKCHLWPTWTHSSSSGPRTVEGRERVRVCPRI